MANIKVFLSNDEPCKVGGDFNQILSKIEKKGGKKFVMSQGLQEMIVFLAGSDHDDISFTGPQFTWCNNKDGLSRILERL